MRATPGGASGNRVHPSQAWVLNVLVFATLRFFFIDGGGNKGIMGGLQGGGRSKS